MSISAASPQNGEEDQEDALVVSELDMNNGRGFDRLADDSSIMEQDALAEVNEQQQLINRRSKSRKIRKQKYQKRDASKHPSGSSEENDTEIMRRMNQNYLKLQEDKRQ